MARKKRATKHQGIQARAEQILLLATISLEEGPEVPCDVDVSLPGVLIWEDYRPEDVGQAQTAAEVQQHIQRLCEVQATQGPQRSLRLHLCPDHLMEGLRREFPKDAQVEAWWLLGLVGQEHPTRLALVRKLPQQFISVCLVTERDPVRILQEVRSLGYP